MTPQQLREWREAMGWSQKEAAAALGLAVRSYIYFEHGETSAGVPRNLVPPYIELAVAELSRRQADAEPKAEAKAEDGFERRSRMIAAGMDINERRRGRVK